MEDVRRNEWLAKSKALYEAYKSEHKEFMERRRHYRKLDEGVAEEREIRQRYHQKFVALAEEYKDIL